MATTFSLSSSSPFSLNPNPLLNPNLNPKPPKHYSLPSFKITCNGPNNAPPIAPWMKRYLVIPSHEKPEKTKTAWRKPNNSLTEKVSGARGKRAMREILKGIGKMEKSQKNPVEDSAKDECFVKVGERMPLEGEEKGLVEGPLVLRPHEKPGKSTIFGRKPDSYWKEKVNCTRGKREIEEILNGVGKMEKTRKNPIEKLAKDEGLIKVGGRMPWEGEERGLVIGRIRKAREPTAAELTVDEEVLKRLRVEAAKMRVWVKVKKAGVTQDVVDQVWITWRHDKLAMMKFDVPLKWNMDRAREIIEQKTGGLVVWTKKDTLVVYRGCNYKLGLETSPERHSTFLNGNVTREKTIEMYNNDTVAETIKGSLYEREADRLLDGLGPRFIDWWMAKPLPVDADLLPEVVPDFKPPFRLCPPQHAKAKLTDYELTYLRKLARPLPTHFALGRNRKLQGLAAAILKLWEKCHIVKIAIKWGAMNTSNEEMANELKDLTGGVLLLRNKFIIILYRGKDFLPCGVADLVVDREMELREWQREEEAARSKAVDVLDFTDESSANSSSTGTLSEYLELQSDRAHLYDGANVQFEAEKENLDKQLRTEERKLMILEMKIKRSSRELAKLNSAWRPVEKDADQEIISEEERACFRKIGLKLDSSLLLGRRGVFKGVIEGIYQHWKHREIAKVITMQRLLSQVVYTAKQLEAETGGMLVSVDKLNEGHAIILYRGKNHRRPQNFVSPNLLTKRQALSRSLEMQRIGSLKFFAYQRRKAITELKSKLADLGKRRGNN